MGDLGSLKRFELSAHSSAIAGEAKSHHSEWRGGPNYYELSSMMITPNSTLAIGTHLLVILFNGMHYGFLCPMQSLHKAFLTGVCCGSQYCVWSLMHVLITGMFCDLQHRVWSLIYVFITRTCFDIWHCVQSACFFQWCVLWPPKLCAEPACFLQWCVLWPPKLCVESAQII